MGECQVDWKYGYFNGSGRVLSLQNVHVAGCQSFSLTKSMRGRMPGFLTDKKYAWQDARVSHGQKVCVARCQSFSRTKSMRGRMPEFLTDKKYEWQDARVSD